MKKHTMKLKRCETTKVGPFVVLFDVERCCWVIRCSPPVFDAPEFAEDWLRKCLDSMSKKLKEKNA